MLLLLITVLVTFNCAGQYQLIEARGLGEEFLRMHDTSDGQAPDDTLFKPTQRDHDLIDSDKFVNSLKEVKVDLVAPNKQLRDLMNTISTRTRSMFFENYDHFFNELDIGSTSRPMLFTYLGLKFATQEQMSSWYNEQKTRVQGRIIEGCNRLMNKHESSITKLSQEQQETLNTITKASDINRTYVAHIVFKNNLNLFMLENYLLLCSRLEPESTTANLMI